MKAKKYNLGKTYKDIPNIQVSFFTRNTAMDVCFGDTTDEEENLAYSILRSIKKVSYQ
jgi:hypothetical protein